MGTIVVGDIGGTNSRLGIVQRNEDGRLQIGALETFASRQYRTFDEVVKKFLQNQKTPISAACFGVAGPIKAGRCATMNLAWVVDQRELAERLGIPHVSVINDLESMAYGVSCLGPDDMEVINPGAPDAAGHAVVVSPGTGLGEAAMYWDGRQYHAIPTEGGHTVPRTRVDANVEGKTFPKTQTKTMRSTTTTFPTNRSLRPFLLLPCCTY